MSERQRLPLSAHIRIKHGYAFPGADFSDDPLLPTLLTPGNFAIGGGFKETRTKTFAGEYPPEYELSPGDLIISMTDLSKEGDTLGLPAIVPDEGRYLHNQRVGLVEIIDPDCAHSYFLNYYLRTDSYRAYILGTASGSTVRHTSPSRIGAFEAALPSLGEQRAVAEVLGALDDKIAANTKLASTASDLSASLLMPYVNSLPLSEIVWHRKKSTNPEVVSDTKVAHFSLPAFDTAQRPEVCHPASIKSNKFLIEKPSVLISKLNPRFPRIWDVANLPDIPALASTEFLVLEPKEESTAVIWAILSQPKFSASLESQVAGTSSSHQRVRPDDLLSTLVPDPSSVPLAVKRQITALGSRVATTRVENITLAITRDALLPQLMSGKLRVRDAEALVVAAV